MEGRHRARTAPGERSPSFLDALRTRAFGVVFAAEAQSIAGDQLARVALSVVVFHETGSAAATGLTFAATFLPAIVGGPVLGRLGDRLPRRRVMVVADLVRALLFAAMTLPGVPTPGLVTLLVLAVFVSPVFGAAAVSYLAAQLEPEVFRAGTGLRMLSSQGSQVVGFAVGGALVAALGARSVLGLDALTFVVSALLIGAGAPREPGPPAPPDPSEASPARAGLWRDRRVRRLVLLSALAAFFVAPEGLAVPFAAELGGSTTAAGLLLASIPLGSVAGIYVLVRRVPPAKRATVAGVMAVGAGVPLLASGLPHSLPAAAALWFVSGAGAAYQVEVLTRLVHMVPDAVRSRALGVVNAILLGAQGLGVAAFGAVADGITARAAVALAGGIGAVAAVCLVWWPDRLAPSMASAGALRTE